MNILLCTDVIHAGGAETFVLRLANALQQRGHSVTLFLFFRDRSDEELLKHLSPEVQLVFAHLPLGFLLQKADGLFLKLRLDFSVRENLISRQLKKLIAARSVEVVHSHLFTADWMVYKAIAHRPSIKMVSTQHGDYRHYYLGAVNGENNRLLHFKEKAARVLNRLDHIVCISDEQIGVLEQPFFPQVTNKISKIFNGYTAVFRDSPAVMKSLADQYRFIVGMVARGIREKGWGALVEAFLKMRVPNACLVLIGEGPYLSELQARYGPEQHIYFIGKVTNPVDYIKHFTVGCLPSQLKAESLPTVIIEYLFCGKPVLATRVGEIASMVKEGTEQASGVLIPVEEHGEMVTQLQQALEQMLGDEALLQRLASNTAACLAEFDMTHCVSSYENLYRTSREKQA